MADMTICATPNCPLAHKCYRKIAKAGQHRQSMAYFMYCDNGVLITCSHLIDIYERLNDQKN